LLWSDHHLELVGGLRVSVDTGKVQFEGVSHLLGEFMRWRRSGCWATEERAGSKLEDLRLRRQDDEATRWRWSDTEGGA
jgi:hypothetical protein